VKGRAKINLLADADAEAARRLPGRKFRADGVMAEAEPELRVQIDTLLRSTRKAGVISDVLRRHGIALSVGAINGWRRVHVEA